MARAITDLSGSASLQRRAQKEGITKEIAITDLSGSASLQQVDRPGSRRRGPDHHRSLGIGLIAAIPPRSARHHLSPITDLSGSASLQPQHLRVAFYTVAGHHRSLGIGLIAAAKLITVKPWSQRHHRSLGIGLIAAKALPPPGSEMDPITDLSGSASLQPAALRLHRAGPAPSPISRDRPHCSKVKRGISGGKATAITDLSGSASLQPDRIADLEDFERPSPISRDRPHCSAGPAVSQC